MAPASKKVWEVAVRHGVKHLMYASSAAVYGTPTHTNPIREDDVLKPSNPYGVAKLDGEESLRSIVSGVNYLIFRFFNVAGAEAEGRLGQNRKSRAIMQRGFAVASGQVEKLIINGHDYPTMDGTVVRDFVHVEDIALAFVLGLNYLRKGGKSQVINLGSGEDHTIGEVLKEVEIVTGKKLNTKYGPRVDGDIRYSLADINKARVILGWEPVSTLKLIVRDGWNAYEK